MCIIKEVQRREGVIVLQIDPLPVAPEPHMGTSLVPAALLPTQLPNHGLERQWMMAQGFGPLHLEEAPGSWLSSHCFGHLRGKSAYERFLSPLYL